MHRNCYRANNDTSRKGTRYPSGRVALEQQSEQGREVSELVVFFRLPALARAVLACRGLTEPGPGSMGSEGSH